MVRRFVLWLLMLILPWQGALAAAHVQSIPANHSAAHWQDHDHGVSHHHDDEGHVQYDHSEASLDHGGDHLGCQFNAAPVSETTFAPPMMAGHVPATEPHGVRPDPFLDKPPRPPHASA